MADIVRTGIREAGTQTLGQYRQRVHLLAAAYVVSFLASVAGIGLLIWKAELFVGLTQRSNVETLTLGFFLVFFAYVASISAPGLPGAIRIAYYALLVRLGQDPRAVEQRKIRALGPPRSKPTSVALNRLLELDTRPGQPFTVGVADSLGSMGSLQIDGAALSHQDSRQKGSNSLLAFFVEQVNQLLKNRDEHGMLDIVEWKSIDNESAEEFINLVHFARNLERQLGAGELWPKETLSEADVQELEHRLATLCPSLRDEAFLPEWEYAGEHKLPIIPEPLGLLTLSRSEKRVDPEASIGCAVLVVLATVAIFAIFIRFPPWVPGP